MPDTKTCPDCAETVNAEARVCRFCGFRFDLAEERQREAEEEEAGLSWWERAVRSLEREAARREAEKPPKVLASRREASALAEEIRAEVDAILAAAHEPALPATEPSPLASTPVTGAGY